jgi:hypothetical protein
MMYAAVMSLQQVLPAASPAVGRQEHHEAHHDKRHAQLPSLLVNGMAYCSSTVTAGAVLLQQV